MNLQAGGSQPRSGPGFQKTTPPKTKMTIKNPPFEEVFPIEVVMFQCHVSFQGV